MKISTLLKREPFEKIFEETMVLFLDDLTGNNYKVSWNSGKTSKSLSDSDQYWYCNPLINSIFVKKVNSSVFSSINGEYQYNPLRPWRIILQKIYLLLSQSKITSVFMSKNMVTFSPAIEDAKNKLIIGGNTKIRIIDISSKKVYVILKNGFARKYLEREVYARDNFPYLPIPKIDEYSSQGLWYREEYIVGLSPNRMAKSKGESVLCKVVEHIFKMLNETKKETTVFEYTKTLQKKINSDLDSISYIDKKVKDKMKNIVFTLVGTLEEHLNEPINIAYCHGDFHQGNILSDEKNYWILDWEYSGHKQIGYDLFILLLESRIENGFSDRFYKLMNNKFDRNQMELINNWPGINWNNKVLKKIYLTIFLLEDIYFHIDENNNNIFYKDVNIFADYCLELDKIVYNTNWTIYG
jgi:hypothetical protein